MSIVAPDVELRTFAKVQVTEHQDTISIMNTSIVVNEIIPSRTLEKKNHKE